MADLIINSLLAPGYSTVTFTFGGDILGNCVTGSDMSASAPRNTMMSDITIDNTGRCMNLLNIAYWI
jgi:hypothetical protein